MKNTKSLKQWKSRLEYFLIGAGLMLIVLPIVFWIIYLLMYNKTVYEGVKIGRINASSLTHTEVVDILSEEYLTYKNAWPSTYNFNGEDYQLNGLVDVFVVDVDASASIAVDFGKKGSVIENLESQWRSITKGVNLSLEVRINNELFDEIVASAAAEMNVDFVPPTLTVAGGEIEIIEGESGIIIDEDRLKQELLSSTSNFRVPSNNVPAVFVETITDEEVLIKTKEMAEHLYENELKLVFEHDDYLPQEWVLSGEELVSFVDFNPGLDREKVKSYVMEIAKSLDRKPQNAKFEFNDESNKVEEFLAAKYGVETEIDEATEKIIRSLLVLSKAEEIESVQIPVSYVKPEISLDSVNDMGLNTLLGRGTSTYFHSIPTRVHNVSLAASRITGAIIPPGEVFSFNGVVGDISKNTGYQSAYIISNGRTVLGDGGGVCQDSTTVFRAALNAGLPIVERRGHAYRVGYYEQDSEPGIDATVYSPTTDLKFKNNTPAYILIQAKADTPNRSLVVEIYGTDDGRTARIENHKLWGVSPPPPDIYQDDPTLAAGVIKQVDWKAWGAKTKFDYVVERDGEVLIEKTFTTNYKPWAAVYLRGTGQ